MTTIAVHDETSFANVDGIRTSDGWALVTRVKTRSDGVLMVSIIKRGRHSLRLLAPGDLVDVHEKRVVEESCWACGYPPSENHGPAGCPALPADDQDA